ncbi:hypothetical protein ACFLZ2_04885 [Candidatus Margulisiibacteriota bacterium]
MRNTGSRQYKLTQIKQKRTPLSKGCPSKIKPAKEKRSPKR